MNDFFSFFSTQVVFRSASVQLFLYLQISREMWEFDQSGAMTHTTHTLPC